MSRLPDGVECARKSAFDQRCIQVVPDRDGMANLYGYLPTEVAEAFFIALDTHPQHHPRPADREVG